MNETEILERILNNAVKKIKQRKSDEYPENIKINVDILIEKIDKNKSLVSALITSFLKKIITPEQDIRLHRTDFENGYSARSLDAQITAPFFKKHFPKYANKETAFLTLAIREKIDWTKKNGLNLKIRDQSVKKSFLELVDIVEVQKIDSSMLIEYFFVKLLILSKKQKQIFDDALNESNYDEILNINKVILMLKEHFKVKLSSRLPVIAIYTIYQELSKTIKRYDNKILKPLNVHTSSDKHGYGDVEIWNSNDTPFEMVEIKHNIPIDRNMIFDITKKVQGTTVLRYYILTTSEENFTSDKEEEYINKFILQIKKDHNLEVIANGIIQSLKYYLRFIEDYNSFIINYTKNLIKDSELSTEIEDFHITEWNNILKKYRLENI